MEKPSIKHPEFLKNKYWGFKEFRDAVLKSSQRAGKAKPETQPHPTQIPLYIQRIIEILNKPRGKELVETQILFKKYIIKPENITNDYLKNIILGSFAELKGYNREQLANEEIKRIIIEQFEKETGKNFKTYQIPEEEKKRLIDQIIEDQKRSLNLWFNYLTSPEAQQNYPPEFRYWAFAEVLKLGNYDEKEKKFNERTKTTTVPYPHLDAYALSIVLDIVISKYEKRTAEIFEIIPPEERKELEELRKQENFNLLYSWALEYIKKLKLPKERLPIINGQWKVYKEGSNPKELTADLRKFPTGWCIASEATAENYLFHSDVYIYYSLDAENKPTIPRVAVVYNHKTQRITEIRGIAESQNLDEYIAPVVERSLKEGIKIEEKTIKLLGAENYLKATQDMKKLAAIYTKYRRGEDLTNEELEFLYEIDELIKSFGYENDPRINEIIRSRNIKKDLAKIFGCQENQITLNNVEFLETTKRGIEVIFHYRDLDLKYLKSAKGLNLPKRIRGYLDLGSLTSAEGLKLPEKIGGSLYLSRLTSAEGLKLPEEIGGGLDLRSLTSAEGLELPEEIGGYLYLNSLTSAEGLELPEKIGGGLYLSSLTSAEGLKLPEEIGGSLDLSKLTSAKGLKLPEKIGGSLYFDSLTSAKGLKLPEEIGGSLYLNSLTSTEGLELERLKILGNIYFGRSLIIKEIEGLKAKYPHLKDKIRYKW